MSPPAWAGALRWISDDGSYMTTALGRHAAQREEAKRAGPLHLDAQSRVRVSR